jgi:ribosome-binding ATPase YchF (GTP1/OBG family)
MGVKCVIVGLLNVGKPTIFNAITSAGANSASTSRGSGLEAGDC